ncbi:MAG: efflux RND transporter periplasmic adaptor subunit [Sideroxydans sp.]
MNKTQKWGGAGALLLLAALATMKSGASDAPRPTVTNRPALTVKTTALQTGHWDQSLTANGSIVPWQEAVISAQVQGVRIAEVRVSVGDRVSKGQVLATLDNLVHTADAPETPQGRIVAPDDGLISVASANVGSMVQPGAELFRLIRQGRMEWRADLTAEELMRIRKGMPVEVTLGEGRRVRGWVRAISPSVNAQTRYGFALVRLERSDGIIAGAFARGTFDLSGGRKTVQTLPQSAVLQRGQAAYVLTVGNDGRVHELPVVIGQRNGDRIEIRQGLQPGVPVVESGGAFLSEGDAVQIVQ